MVKVAYFAASAVYLLLSGAEAALYTKKSPVLQLDGKSYDRLIAKSNYTSIVEFYAPWCGHCQNLKPAYEKAASNLAGLAKVAAVNCDEDANKSFCGTMGIQGFPTLKIVRPSKKSGKPTVEDYKGPRSAKGIVDAVIDKIPNHVKRLSDKDFDSWLKEEDTTAKAILFTEKGATTPLIRAIAIDFLGTIDIAQVRSKEQKIAEKYGVSDFPKLILLPGDDKEPIVYDGEMKKPAIVEFLSQISPPNPDPPSKPGKNGKPVKAADQKYSASASSAFSEASAAHESADKQSAKTEQMSETIEEAPPQETVVDPNDLGEEFVPPPFIIPEGGPPMIPMLEQDEEVRVKCLQEKSSTCVLAFLPAKESDEDILPESARDTLLSLGEIQAKHEKRKTKLFPFYSIPATNVVATNLRSNLGLRPEDSIEIIAINARRNWYKQYSGSAYGVVELEEWVDKIRMGEGEKKRIPEGVIPEEAEEQPAVEEEKKEESEVHDEL